MPPEDDDQVDDDDNTAQDIPYDSEIHKRSQVFPDDERGR